MRSIFDFEILTQAMAGILDAMIVSVMKTARSNVVKDNLDFSAAICDHQGRLLLQGLSLPGHLGAIVPALEGCLEVYQTLNEGDVVAVNDPYHGASHLNDIFMFAPLFDQAGTMPLGYLCLVIHHADLGGRVPGGQATDSREIFEEGLRLPPVKFREAGAPSKDLVRLIASNSRVPIDVAADLHAQLGAVDLGLRHFKLLLSRWSPDEIRAFSDWIIERTRRRFVERIAGLGAIDATFTDLLDDYGYQPSPPVEIQVRLRTRSGRFEVDFTGTSPQLSGSINPNFEFTKSCTYAALRTLFEPELPTNSGFYELVEVKAPPGTFVNPRFPAALGARGQGAHRVRTAVLGAIAEAFPDRFPACPGGSDFSLAISGYREDASRFVYVESHMKTGHGGGPDCDGQEGGPYCLGNVANIPVETIEIENPIRVSQYALRPDTEGPGRHRGCLGIVRDYEILCEEVFYQIRSDRRHRPPWGVAGGQSSEPGAIYLIRDGRTEALPGKTTGTARLGDVIRIEMPGGGGYGPPSQRRRAAIEQDFKEGKMTGERVVRIYGRPSKFCY